MSPTPPEPQLRDEPEHVQETVLAMVRACRAVVQERETAGKLEPDEVLKAFAFLAQNIQSQMVKALFT